MKAAQNPVAMDQVAYRGCLSAPGPKHAHDVKRIIAITAVRPAAPT
jgi:hypothetical protein